MTSADHDKSYPIDLIYTWVTDDDNAYRDLIQQYAMVKSDSNPERTRDLYQMLKYSLRSVDQFAPWFRNIYIVTARPQVPTWLNLSHSQLKVVHHDEMFDDPRFLPTFNCHCIETYFHGITGLSDHFLFMNDDFMFGREIRPSDFLSEDGKLLIYGTVFGERLPFIYPNRLNDTVSFLQHTPRLFYRPYYEEILRKWSDEIYQTRLRRFRTRQDIMLHGLYRYYCLKYQANHTQAIPAHRYLKYYRFHKITNHYAKQKKRLQNIRNMRPKFYCLNDDQRDQPNPQVTQLTQEFLDAYYPRKSQYER